MNPPASLARFPDDLEDRLLGFEDAWSAGPPADLRAFCPPDPEPAFVLELVRIDVARRRAAGAAVQADAYLAAFPELATDSEVVRQVAAIAGPADTSADPDRTTDASGPSAAGPDGGPGEVAVRSAYADIRKHAQGGLGEVFVAEDVALGRRVALKMLRAGRGGSRRARRDFLQEVEVTSRLEHPGIVPVHGIGETPDGRPCYSMRFVEGETLQAAIRRYHETPAADPGQRALAFRDLLARFVAICNTLAYAHSRGVLHRDLKPDNVMLGPFGETLVVDWGLAKRVGEAEPARGPDGDEGDEATRAGDLLGTPAYMSPEQAAGEVDRFGPATDVFGLGAILYAILTGAAPYREASALAALEKARAGAFVPPRQRSKAVPAALDAVCRKALARDPAGRYAAAQDLGRDVESYLAGERVSAWKEPWHVGARRYLHRRRTLTGALVTVAVVLPLALGVGGWLIEREQAQGELDRRTAEIKGKAAQDTAAYLVKTFQTADPVGLDAVGFHGPGERSDAQTIRRMLDGGAELLRTHLHDQPLVRAGLLDAMGNSYRSLGDWDRAGKLLQEGYDLREAHLGPAAADTLASLHSLARLDQDRGDYASAARRYREVILGRSLLKPEQPLLVAETKTHLAWLLFYQPLSLDRPQDNQSNLAEAERLLADVLFTRQEHPPASHRDIGMALAGLATVKLVRNNRDPEALRLAGRAIESFRQSDQDTTIGNALVAYMAAESHRREWRWDEADKLYVRILAIAQKNLGLRHPLTILHMANMAGMYRYNGDMNKLHPMARTLLEAVRESPQMRSHPLIVDAMVQYGDILKSARAPAAPGFSEALKVVGMLPNMGNAHALVHALIQSGDVLKKPSHDAIAVYTEALKFARQRPAGNERNIEALTARLKDVPAPAEKK